MLTNSDLLTYSQWSGILTLVCGAVAAIAFIFKWSFRFRLVGATGFMGVLTAGIFALSLGLYSRVEIPGAVRYSLVYDTGGTQAVIAVPPSITESQLEATMRQAANDLYSWGRVARGLDQMVIRVRTIVHPEEGISQPVYVGEVRRSLEKREDEKMEIKIFPKSLASLKQYQA
ncbi:MAG: Ycf51 family protein [Actinomycetota bacterium]